MLKVRNLISFLVQYLKKSSLHAAKYFPRVGNQETRVFLNQNIGCRLIGELSWSASKFLIQHSKEIHLKVSFLSKKEPRPNETEQK